jgi:hypothetical protein
MLAASVLKQNGPEASIRDDVFLAVAQYNMHPQKDWLVS